MTQSALRSGTWQEALGEKQHNTDFPSEQSGVFVKLWPPKFRKAARITVETEQVVIIRRRRITRSWCSQCGDESEFIPVEAVNRALGGGLCQGKLLPPGDGVHLRQVEGGSVLVCMKSLSKS